MPSRLIKKAILAIIINYSRGQLQCHKLSVTVDELECTGGTAIEDEDSSLRREHVRIHDSISHVR